MWEALVGTLVLILGAAAWLAPAYLWNRLTGAEPDMETEEEHWERMRREEDQLWPVGNRQPTLYYNPFDGRYQSGPGGGAYPVD